MASYTHARPAQHTCRPDHPHASVNSQLNRSVSDSPTRPVHQDPLVRLGLSRNEQCPVRGVAVGTQTRSRVSGHVSVRVPLLRPHKQAGTALQHVHWHTNSSTNVQPLGTAQKVQAFASRRVSAGEQSGQHQRSRRSVTHNSVWQWVHLACRAQRTLGVCTTHGPSNVHALASLWTRRYGTQGTPRARARARGMSGATLHANPGAHYAPSHGTHPAPLPVQSPHRRCLECTEGPACARTFR